jgi:hypothetical protein
MREEDNAELKRMVEEDQADRQGWEKFTKADTQRMTARDTVRLAGVKELLRVGKVVTSNDFDNASLLFQHGVTTDDYLIAHELGIVLAFFGQRITSIPALSEDRFLQSIRRRQRFGSQCTKDGKRITPVSEGKNTDVTDALRTDYLLPSLAEAKASGVKAFQQMQAVFTRFEARMESTSVAAHELATLAATPTQPGARERVLSLYQGDELVTPAGYRCAAEVLLRVGKGEDFLLAHELATVAAIRRDMPARRLLAEAWDRFLMSVKLPQRYGTVPGARRAEGVSPIVCNKFLE